MTRPLVYVAGPITGDPWGCVRKAINLAAALDGAHLFDTYLPQLSVLHEMIDTQPYERWIEHGLNMVGRCDGLYRLPGESPGADGEVARAEDLGIPVYVAAGHKVLTGEFPDWADLVRRQWEARR